MLPSQYIEDLFVQFYDLVMIDDLPLQHQDLSACSSFYSVILQDKELTQNQANFILKLLSKYQSLLLKSSLDYSEALKNPQWKNNFRILDLAKKIFVEKDEMGVVRVCVKFPYQLKKEFDDEFEEANGNQMIAEWNADRKLRQFKIYDCNLIQLYEWAQKHNFEIDDTFMIALAEVEEIWQNQEDITPCSSIVLDQVELYNCVPGALEWWENNRTGNVNHNLLLAKSMGILFDGKPQNLPQKIAASPGNSFWIKTNRDFFELYDATLGKVVAVLDRTANKLEWVQKFIQDAEDFGINLDEIKICFREGKDSQTGLNDWIKEKQLGGSIANGRLFIFEYKPAKWLFKNQENVTMLVSNNLYPSTNNLTKDWFKSHPLAIYLGDIKPATLRGHNIVEL